MSIDVKESIVIIDEAHNVEDVCRSALTKSYTLEDLEITVAALQDLMNQKGRYKLPHAVWEAVSEIKCFVGLVKSWMDEREQPLLCRLPAQCVPAPSNGKE